VTDLLSPDEPLTWARVYVAGPPAMVEATVARLKELGLPEERVHADAFTLGPALPQATDEA
jgi:ferredoxin-NADP reductase